MECEDFRASVFQFVDGELPDAAARAATAHANACPDCGERVQFERALETRLRSALLADAPEVVAAALVSAARSRVSAELCTGAEVGAGPGAAVGHRTTFPGGRALLAVAAALLLSVQAAWFFCIPPFECSLLQAVEQTTATPGIALRPGVAGPPVAERVVVTPVFGGFALAGDPVLLDSTPARVRAHYVAGTASAGVETGAVIDVVWSDVFGSEPSFRRKRVIGPLTWWVAEENGRQLVAWMCPMTRTLCTLVSDLPEEHLLEIAGELRAGER